MGDAQKCFTPNPHILKLRDPHLASKPLICASEGHISITYYEIPQASEQVSLCFIYSLKTKSKLGTLGSIKDSGKSAQITKLVPRFVGFRDAYDHVVRFKHITQAYEPLIDVIRIATFGLTLEDIVLNPRLLIDL